MLRIDQHGPVTVFRMGRHVAANRRWVLYETHAFLIDDTMIDTGTIAVRKEWLPKLDGCPCSTIVNTHHYEDHIGNNRLFQDRFGATIVAHPGALEFLWADAAVNRRWQRFALQLASDDCERLLRHASRRGLGGRQWRWLPNESATDGWAIGNSGRAVTARPQFQQSSTRH